MTKQQQSKSEPERLEQLWSGEFGDAYTQRNATAGELREPFWSTILPKYRIANVLEVGCNVGANLRWISKLIPPRHVYAVDINEQALAQVRNRLPMANVIWSPARRLPFRDMWFDLVFTSGVLIHQPAETLPIVMAEIVRCSRLHIVCLEYFSEETVQIPYRGQERALFKRDYGRIYLQLFPELTLLESGTLTPEQGWDDVNYWLFTKRSYEAA